MPQLPAPRGEISELLITSLVGSPRLLPAGPLIVSEDPLIDEDLQLGLYICYELHYRGFAGVDERWEWEPSLLHVRRQLEQCFEAGLQAAVEPREESSVAAEEMDLALRQIAAADGGPELSRHIQRSASTEQVLEFVIHRSAYQLKEADPHSWAIPRLWGGPKSALVEIQADEYGGGRADRAHAHLFAETMQELGLDPAYGAYLNRIPGSTLATVNLISLLGLHRRLRGAVAGHLALFEMTSSVPNRRYAQGLRRLGFGPRATGFFDEHVIADAVHENIAAVELAGGLARQDPALTGDILWGARAVVEVEGGWGRGLLDAWSEHRSSLLPGPETFGRVDPPGDSVYLAADTRRGAEPSRR